MFSKPFTIAVISAWLFVLLGIFFYPQVLIGVVFFLFLAIIVYEGVRKNGTFNQ